jgi:hypothetical protein
MKHAFVIALVVAGTLAAAAINGELTATAAQSCETLASLTLPNTTVTLAQTVGAGAFTPPRVGPFGSCRRFAVWRQR